VEVQRVASAKETMTKIIEQQPEDSSYEEIFRERAMARMIERGPEDSDAGRVIDHDELKRRMESWRK
jgi:predicted transcriptional regulator